MIPIYGGPDKRWEVESARLVEQDLVGLEEIPRAVAVVVPRKKSTQPAVSASVNGSISARAGVDERVRSPRVDCLAAPRGVGAPPGSKYKVVSPPVGAVVSSVPDGTNTVVKNGNTYFKYANTYYQAQSSGGEVVYKVVTVPA